MKTHADIVALLEDARAVLPPDMYLGYAVPHTHEPDGSEIPTAERRRATQELTAALRAEASLREERAQEEDLEGDDVPRVTIELLHLPTGMTLYQTIPMADLLAMAELKTASAKARTLVRDAIGVLNGRRMTDQPIEEHGS